MIARILAHFTNRSRIKTAQAELARIVTERANSHEIHEYRMRRAAAKLGHARRRAA